MNELDICFSWELWCDTKIGNCFILTFFCQKVFVFNYMYRIKIRNTIFFRYIDNFLSLASKIFMDWPFFENNVWLGNRFRNLQHDIWTWLLFNYVLTMRIRKCSSNFFRLLLRLFLSYISTYSYYLLQQQQHSWKLKLFSKYYIQKLERT